MSWRDQPDDFERELTAGLERLAPRPRRDSVDRAMRTLADTPQRPGWRVGVLRMGGLVAWPRAVAVGAVAVVALVVGIAIGTSGRLPSGGPTSSPQPTSSPAAVAWVEPADYQFVLEQGCGLHTVLGTYAVRVEGHEVVDVRTIAARRDVALDAIATLGDLLRQAEELEATGEAEVVLQLDPSDGHPTSLRFTWPEQSTKNLCYVITEYTALASPSPAPTPEVADTFAEWTRIALPFNAVGNSGATASSVTAYKDAYVAVGTFVRSCCDGGDPSENAGLIWGGPDPADWTGGLLVFNHASFGKVLVFGEQLLIVGTYAEPGSDPTHAGPPAVWRTTDATGLNWERIDAGAPSIVALGPDGFVGVRVDRSDPGSHGTSTFVSSADGRTWTEISDQLPVEIMAMAIGPDGAIVGVANTDGQPWPDGTPSQNVVSYLRSPSGAWTVSDPALERGELLTLTAAAGHFYATGYREVQAGTGAFARVEFVPTLWSSTTGTDWTPTQLPWAGYVSGVRAVDGTLMAIGDAIWVSEDGVTWKRVPDQDSLAALASVSDLIQVPNGVLAVGSAWNAEAYNSLPIALLGRR